MKKYNFLWWNLWFVFCLKTVYDFYDVFLMFFLMIFIRMFYDFFWFFENDVFHKNHKKNIKNHFFIIKKIINFHKNIIKFQ